jgi:molybdopterin-guanine dinucleotide biosynthesis protein B
MRRIHIVGRKNHGKTTLMVELIEEFARRGLRVGAMKHSAHAHELDRPGKDSYRHRHAGANPAAIVTRDTVCVFRRRDADEDVYARMAPLFADCDFVLVEGDFQQPGPKIEVWRASAGGECLAAEHDTVLAVVSDDRGDVPVPVWPRHDVPGIAANILGLLRIGGGASG